MRTERLLLLLLLLLFAAGRAPDAAGQALYDVDASTQVRFIRFALSDSAVFTEGELLKQIMLTGQGGLRGLRGALEFIPLVTPVGDHPLDPVELQRDVARLRRYCERLGYRRAVVDYELEPLEDENTVDVTFRVAEGAPTLIRSVEVRISGDTRADDTILAAGHDPQELVRLSGLSPGMRAAEASRARARERLLRHLFDTGHPVAAVEIREEDADSGGVRVRLDVAPGPHAVVSGILIEGERSVRDQVILRELPFMPGDPYSAAELAEGRRELTRLGVFRQVTLEPVTADLHGGGVPVRVTVHQDLPRLVTGDAGYDSRGGLTGHLQWQHRNFTGDARSLTVSLLGQTGVLSLEDIPELLYRGTISFTQPYVLSRKVSAILTPFVEYRDDYRDRSRAFGGTLAFVSQFGDLNNITVQTEISRRTLLASRYGEFTQGRIDILTLLSQVAQGGEVRRSAVKLTGTLGLLDDIANPTEGVSVRPSVEFTVPSVMNSVEYLRLDAAGSVFLPLLPGVAVRLRAAAGRIFPFGKGMPGDDGPPIAAFLAFRDISFTAGGPTDVRGWSTGLLGPKFPDIRATVDGADTTFTTEGYTPVMGLARVSVSAEVRTPMPFLGDPWGWLMMLDGARVWTPDPAFGSAEDPLGEQRFFSSLAGGIEYGTPVGSLRVTLGYKLNPSPLDVRAPEDVLRVLEEDRPIDEVPPKNWMRWQLHLALQVGF